MAKVLIRICTRNFLTNMPLKGSLLLALYKNFDCPESKPATKPQYSTKGLGLSSVIRSLRCTGFMGFHLYTRKIQSKTVYLALLLLCAGDIETNPGPTNIITCFVMLLLLYITLDGCGWSSSFSLAAPVMVFSRQLSNNGSRDNGNDGAGALTANQLIGVGLGIPGALAALLTLLTSVISVIKKYCHGTRPQGVKAVIIKSPDSAAFAVGDKVRLTCNVKNEAEEIRKDLTYQWYKDGSAVIDKTQQDIELSPLKLSDAGMYYCKVTCNKLGDSSDPVNVAINRGDATVTKSPDSASTAVTLTCAVKNVAEEVKNDLRYQWFKDGSPVDKAGESIELSLLKLSDTGIYNCIVTCDRLEDWNVKSDPLNVAVNQIHEADIEDQELFPNLQLDHLDSPHEKTKVKIQLMKAAELIEFKFSSLICDIIKSFTKRKLPPEDLARAFVHLPGLSAMSMEYHKEILEITSIDGIMIKLHDRKYISPFNYHLLKNVIQKIGTEPEQEAFEQYFKHFQEYCKKSIFEVPQTMLSDGMPEGIQFGVKVYDGINQNFPRAASTATLSVENEDKVITYSSEVLGLSVNETMVVVGKLAETLNLDVGNFCIVNAARGCTKLTVSVSRSVAENILPEVDTNTGVAKLRSSGIHVVCGPPGKPQAVEVTATSIKLSWTKPEFDIRRINKYVVFFRSAIRKVKEWKEVQTTTLEETITITESDIAQGGPSFIFKVCAFSESEEGVESEESEEIALIAPGGEARITKSPDLAPIAVGDKVTLTCNVKNVAVVITNDLSYQWFKEGAGVIDKTGKSIELSLLKLSDAGKYRCKVTCNKLGDWSIESDPLPVDVNRGEAKITKSPDVAAIAVGDKVTLTCNVENVAVVIINDLRYQWFKEGSGIIDKTGKSIELSLLKLSDIGKYSCKVTCNKLGDWSVKSDPVPVDVNRGEATITKSPDSAAIAVGDKVRLTCYVESVAETIKKDLKYQWFKEGSRVIDKSGKCIELSLLKLSDAGKYSCKITCDKLGDWNVESNPLPVDINRGEARITKSPDLAAIAAGDKVTLTCNVEYVAEMIKYDLSYQWFKEASGVIDKTGKSIELSLLKLSDAGKYSCKVTCDKLGDWSVESDPLPVDINCGEARITKSPDLAAIAIGDKVTLTCYVESVAEVIKKDLKYQWFKEGSGVIDKTGKSIELSLLKLSDAGKYSCKVTCDKLGDWSVESDPLPVDVNRGEATIAKSSEAVDQITLTCYVKNVAEAIKNDLKYQWFKKGYGIPYKTGKSIELSLFKGSDGGKYFCKVTCDKLGDWSVESDPLPVDVDLCKTFEIWSKV